ncbi:NAD-binding protein, partial [Mycobacterium avium]
DDALATTIVEELKRAGASVARLLGSEVAGTRVKTELVRAGVASAAAIVCAGDDDATNLEIALLARKANPDIRVVARVANDVLRAAVAVDDGPSTILGVADLAAPVVVEACLARTTHPFEVSGIEFVVFGAAAPFDASLRDIYGDLAPVAVVNRQDASPAEVIACPGRDLHVKAGDWTAMIGTTEEVAACGVSVPHSQDRMRARQSRFRRVLYAVRALPGEVNPAFYPVIAALIILVIGSTTLLHFSYTHPGMSWTDAFYFTNETITTTGYGDFSFIGQPTWLRLYAALLMLGGVTTTALLVAFIADVLLSRRFLALSVRPRARHLRSHIIVVGLSALGMRVVTDLIKAGYDVAVIERDQNNPFLSTTAELDVPVIFGDATLRPTLEAARVDTARAVAVLTRDDMVNIETGIVIREMLGAQPILDGNRWTKVPLVLRVYDHDLGSAVAQRFGFENVRSTVELAAPWFIGAAMGLQVLGTFSVENRSFLVGGMSVQAGSELDGMQMFEVSTQARVIAITREDAPVRLHPRRDARLAAGDTVYLVGPYRELLATLRKGQPLTDGSDTAGELPSGHEVNPV